MEGGFEAPFRGLRVILRWVEGFVEGEGAVMTGEFAIARRCVDYRIRWETDV